jgi:hypothetical protein
MQLYASGNAQCARILASFNQKTFEKRDLLLQDRQSLRDRFRQATRSLTVETHRGLAISRLLGAAQV